MAFYLSTKMYNDDWWGWSHCPVWCTYKLAVQYGGDPAIQYRGWIKSMMYLQACCSVQGWSHCPVWYTYRFGVEYEGDPTIQYDVLTGLVFSMRVIPQSSMMYLHAWVLSVRVIPLPSMMYLQVWCSVWGWYHYLVWCTYMLGVECEGDPTTQYGVLTGLVFSMRVIPLSRIKSCATRDTDFSTIRISGSSAAIRATQLRRNSCSYMK